MSDSEGSKALPVSYAHHGEVVFVTDAKLLWELQVQCRLQVHSEPPSQHYAGPKQGHRDKKQLYNHMTAPFRSKLFVHWLRFDYAGKTAPKQLSNLGSEG